jgi:hypothetical protein
MSKDNLVAGKIDGGSIEWIPTPKGETIADFIVDLAKKVLESREIKKSNHVNWISNSDCVPDIIGLIHQRHYSSKLIYLITLESSAIQKPKKHIISRGNMGIAADFMKSIIISVIWWI